MGKRNYNDWSKEELINEIKKLTERKKYGLVWEIKKEDIETIIYDCKHKLPILKEKKKQEIKKNDNFLNNILIEGDNFNALSLLSYTHNNSIDFIFIDPPYNTGARDWKYNNNYVGEDDSYRHSKWLSFMYERLRLTKNLLKEDGIICVTIDDYEMPRLWCVLEDIFKKKNHLGTVIIRNHPSGRKTNRKVSLTHEYALFFGKSSLSKIKRIPIDPKDKTHTYVHDKKKGWFSWQNLRKSGIDSSYKNNKGKIRDRYYPIYYNPKTKAISSLKKYEVTILPINDKDEKVIWRRSKDAIDKMYKDDDLKVKKNRQGKFFIHFAFTGQSGSALAQMPKTIWPDSKYSSEHGSRVLNEILGKRESFNFPKSPELVKECIKVATDNKKAIILDFFAGSGTTGQSVLELNKEDNGNRQFILCTNNENNICTDICYPRIKKVIEGYKFNNKKVEGLGGNVKYFKTDFIDRESTHENKEKLARNLTDVICLKENCYDEYKKKEDFIMFTDKKEKFLVIIYDPDCINEIINEIKKNKKKFIIYIYSHVETSYDEEFREVARFVDLKSFPHGIINTYNEILIKF